MDITKFLSLLENSKLFLARSDSFDDPYEGVWSKAGVNLLKDHNGNNGLPPEAIDQIIKHTDQLKKEMFISCWFASDHESAAMWKLYLNSNEGIAIKTDHDSLCEQIEKSTLKARTIKVTYIDYDHHPIPFSNLFYPFVFKRLSFAHENELRVMVWSGEDVNKSQIAKGSKSVEIDIDLAQLIKAVHVSPTAPSWFGDLVKQLLVRYSLDVPVQASSLYERPTF
ncbi:DUF2971 domain-containing protein [Vibrio hyugaensis]|uniref:DUF2971 domain-containing protein n=1 Tax=Vibrio hyugaensis TaxID=1534743 RepID=UPI0018CE7233|nr:DUF2971 domain-containing protein [Vibrio hyugaensis]